MFCRLIGASSATLRTSLLAGACFTGGCARHGSDYYPLSVGRTWTYQMTVETSLGVPTSVNVTVENLPARSLNGLEVVPQKIEGAGESQFSFMIANDTGVAEYARQSPSAPEPQLRVPPVYALRYPLRAGNSWDASTETSLLHEKIKVPVRTTIERVGETVTVPAGTFENCLKTVTTGKVERTVGPYGRIAVNVEYLGWAAPGIGTIKWISRESSTSLLVGSGESTGQLQSYSAP